MSRSFLAGLYAQPPDARNFHFLEFWKSAGYRYLEYCDIGFHHHVDGLPAYHAELGESIHIAKSRGFQTWVLILAGMRQWRGPGPSGNPGTFSALDKTLLAERLEHIRESVRRLSHADGFVFFAGDPGGDPEGRSTVADCIAFARRVEDIVHADAPRARFAVNLWAIAEWKGFPSPFSVDFWRGQTTLARQVVDEPGLLGPRCGVSFPMDDHYRSLALAAHEEAGTQPVPYPDPETVARLKARKTSPILGWPYFLVDEIDDGFITPNNVASGGQTQFESRYLRAVVDAGRRLGLDGLVANATYVQAEAANIWTFARMCHDPRLAPETALDQWAARLATPSTRAALSRVLRFIENHSNWEHSLPPRHRLPAFDTGSVRTADDALAEWATVRPSEAAGFPLPEPPSSALPRLRRRLEWIREGRIGGVAPLVRSNGR
ncbi:MAG: hypothetical protein ACKO5K_13420 [Armatimonadota bacterium]